jgi:tripartite-type tricarboxylate transporter receptor subunit TctC
MHHTQMKRLILLAALAAASFTALGQTYPNRPVRFIVPFPAGSLPDQIARMISPPLQESLGQPFVIENKPGAIGVVGTAEAARAAPDGHTIVMTTNSTMAAATSLFKKLQYEPLRDFAPIMLISKTSMILLVRPDFPAQSLKEFLAYAKSRNGQLAGGYGSAGSQISIAKLKAGAGFSGIDVPYKGVPPAVTDVLGGQIAFTFADFAVGLGQVKGGKLKGLGVTSAQRTPLAPDIAAIAEEIPGYEVVLWYGLVAPAGTPRDAVDKIYNTVAASMAKAEFKARFSGFGVAPAPMGPDQFAEYIREETEKWSRDIRQAGIEPE